MYRVLTARGIPAKRLLLEEQSRTTAENLSNSEALLMQAGYGVEGRTVAIVTNRFHLCRAKLLSGHGYVPIGIAAPLPWWLSVNYHIREAFALVKALILRDG